MITIESLIANNGHYCSVKVFTYTNARQTEFKINKHWINIRNVTSFEEDERRVSVEFPFVDGYYHIMKNNSFINYEDAKKSIVEEKERRRNERI